MEFRFGGGNGEEGVEDVVLLELGRAFEVEDLRDGERMVSLKVRKEW